MENYIVKYIVLVVMVCAACIPCTPRDERAECQGWDGIVPPPADPPTKLISVRNEGDESGYIEPLPDGGARLVIRDWDGFGRTITAVPALGIPGHPITETIFPDAGERRKGKKKDKNDKEEDDD